MTLELQLTDYGGLRLHFHGITEYLLGLVTPDYHWCPSIDSSLYVDVIEGQLEHFCHVKLDPRVQVKGIKINNVLCVKVAHG